MRKIAIIGLGYVGLPVAVAFGQKHHVIGFDINETRIKALMNGMDVTNEVSREELRAADIRFTADEKDLKEADFYIVAVPTPINQNKQPDLGYLLGASEIVGRALDKGDIVVFESTVYPGATEEECIPVLEKFSQLQAGAEFKVGYSPERINPGDKTHRFTKIRKVVSAQDEDSLKIISAAYSSVVEPGVYEAKNIKVAEAAKVIENTQRDLNIALVNELSIIFNNMEIDTQSVLEAAGTKWNFLPFQPGLVGGHCIGVDPYYLTYKSQQSGYHPQVILSGRKINDDMGKYIAHETVKKMIHAGYQVLGKTVTILGVTFKEDCPDIRNSKVFDVISELEGYGLKVQVYDPEASPGEVFDRYGVTLCKFEDLKPSAAVVVAVAHQEFKKTGIEEYRKIMEENAVLVDLKGVFRERREEFNPDYYWAL